MLRHSLVIILLALSGCVSRPTCGWRGYTHAELATAEAGVRYMDYRGDRLCVAAER